MKREGSAATRAMNSLMHITITGLNLGMLFKSLNSAVRSLWKDSMLTTQKKIMKDVICVDRCW